MLIVALERVANETMKYGPMTFVTILLAALLVPACESQNRSMLGRSEINAPTFVIRITEFEEKRFPLSKFCYVFEAKPGGAAEWIPVMSALTDDSIPVSREHVSVLNDQAAYLFMEDKYAVTTNGGFSWHVWSVDDGISDVDYRGQFFISEVNVNPDGTGTLMAIPRSSDRQAVQLKTVDFGHSWRQ